MGHASAQRQDYLNGVDPYLPAYLSIDEAMRARLAEGNEQRIVFFSESLDAQRFSPDVLDSEYVTLFAKKYHAVKIDAVVVVSRAALEFFKQHGATLWPGARVVYQGFPGESVTSADLPPDAIGVGANQDIGATISLARRLQPEAQSLLFIGGSTARPGIRSNSGSKPSVPVGNANC